MEAQMSGAPGSGAGGEGPAPGSDAQALASLESILEAEEPKPRQPRQPQPTQDQPAAEAAEDAGPEPPPPDGDEEEQPAPSEDDEGAEPADEPEEEPSPAIDPPASWNAKDRAEWQKLTPEAQAIVARREGERDRYIQQRTTQLAEENRASAQERLKEAQEYAQNIQRLLFVASPEAQAFASIDWQKLARESPDDYVRLTAERDALRGRIGTLQSELQRVEYATQQQAAEYQARVKEEQLTLLKQRLPVLADPEKGPKLARDMGSWLTEQGFSADEIGSVFDHRVLLVVEKAMRADRAAAARKQVTADRAPAPTVQQPGTKQRTDRTAAQRRESKMNALKKTGSNQDAIAYLMEIL